MCVSIHILPQFHIWYQKGKSKIQTIEMQSCFEILIFILGPYL